MKTILTLFALMILPFAPAMAEDMAVEEMMKTPATYAVAFHSDNCGSCKILAPKVAEAKANLSEEMAAKIEFVKFDFTNETTTEASATLAAAKGLTAAFEGKVKTGMVKIIDAESGDVLAVLKKDLSPEEMKGAITAVTSRS